MFDIYHDNPSVKDSERLRRQDSCPINLSEISDSTPLPKDMATFWPSNSNEALLEKLVYMSLRKLKSNYHMVIGQLAHGEEKWQCMISHGESAFVPYMTSQPYFEEADLQIVLRVSDSISSGYTYITVLSNDTDVILLYHMHVFLHNGLQELWVKGGKGDTTRYIPTHTLYEKLGSELCSVLPALHSLTGCDITSKIGTKKAGHDANPVSFLCSFGKHPILNETEISMAEQFLSNVLKKNGNHKSFDELRVALYNFSNDKSHWNLPPTSTALVPHIKRAFYNTYCLTHIVEGTFITIDPLLYGFVMTDSLLLPERLLNELSDHWTVKCKCKCKCKCADQHVPVEVLVRNVFVSAVARTVMSAKNS